MNGLRWFFIAACGIGTLLIGGCQESTPPTSTTARKLLPDETWQGKVVLGSASLTAGIPGEGPLTTAQLRAWLADPANHEVLAVALPLGLRTEDTLDSAELGLTRAKIELGRQLFFDVRLSEQAIFACGTCHQPIRQFTSDILSHARLRETATVFNRLGTREQFWDGRATSLEDQIHFPLENSDEFATTAEKSLARIQSIEGYRLQFTAIFGRFDYESLCQAIAAFERVLVTGPSAWDYDVELKRLEALESKSLTLEQQQWLNHVRSAAEQDPLSSAARRGAELFFSDRAGCSRCHSGPNFTDEQYYDVGLRARPGSKSPVSHKESADLGRFHVTGQDADRHKFKTPTLRNVALTWPYLHNARYAKLSDVVDHFARGGDAQDDDLEPLDLTATEKADLVAFLQALTGSLPKPPIDRLPE